jgi:hypothetical protein
MNEKQPKWMQNEGLPDVKQEKIISDENANQQEVRLYWQFRALPDLCRCGGFSTHAFHFM